MTLPKFVYPKTVKGRTYYYFRRGGKLTRLPDPYHEPGFSGGLREMLRGAARTDGPAFDLCGGRGPPLES